MPIVANQTDSFPGAAAVALEPYGPLDCCRYVTLQELAVYLSGIGAAYTFRGGMLFTERSVAQLLNACAVDPPGLSSCNPDPLQIGVGATVSGVRFRSAGGELWLADDPTWGSAVVKVEQSAPVWNATTIVCPSITQGALPVSPQHVYVFVVTQCGQMNAVGFETELV